SVGAGAVWVLSSTAGAVLRIDPAFGFLRGSRRVDLGSAPSIVIGDPAGVAARGHSVWFEDGRSLFRVDPDTGKVVRRIPLGTGLDGIALGTGSVWASRGDPATLLRIDPRSGAVRARIPIAQ